MRFRTLSPPTLAAGVCMATAAAAAITCFAEGRPWLAERDSLASWLETAEVLSVADVGQGVTKPRKVTLKQGEVVFHGVYKPIRRGRHSGFWESYQAEVAAYELDRLVGLNMVPATVVRRVEADEGSLQFWVPSCELYKQVEGSFPMTPAFSRQVSRMKMFDNLIYNTDRNGGNFLIDPDGNIVLIDHSRAFTERKNLLDKWLPVQFDRKLVQSFRALGKPELEAALGELLMKGQVEAILERRDALMAHLDRLVAERGEAAVLFD